MIEEIRDYFNEHVQLASEFKNILVQHSTLADASYIAQFNRDLYLNLLDKFFKVKLSHVIVSLIISNNFSKNI